MGAGVHFVKINTKKLHIYLKWRKMRWKVIFGHLKWPSWLFCEKVRIDLKWREMRLKVIFGHPKWQPAVILWRIYPPPPKKKKLHIDLKWREMRSKVIFGHPQWPSKMANL